VSAFASAGQRQNSTARVFAVRAVFDKLCERFADRARELVVGYGFDEGVFLGPMISDAHRAKFRRALKDLITEGHTPILEGGSATVEGRRGYYVRPAIHWVGNGACLAEEPVGPVAQVYCVEDVEEAIDLHNRQSFRLATSVFGRDEEAIKGVVARLSTGCVNVNRGTIGSSPRLASVGRGRSSNGIAGDMELLRFLTIPKAVLIDPRPFDTSRWVPGTGTIAG